MNCLYLHQHAECGVAAEGWQAGRAHHLSSVMPFRKTFLSLSAARLMRLPWGRGEGEGEGEVRVRAR